jgi:hypothetical protein
MARKVTDYENWKKPYDANTERRTSASLREAYHYHSTDDRNSFLIAWDHDGGVDAARAVDDDMMKEAGVLKKPTSWIV